MLEVVNLSVRSLDVDHLDVFWEIKDTREDPYDYTFTMERSESALGPFDQISEPFSDRYLFRDVRVNPFHRSRKYFYRIKIVRKSDSKTAYSDVATREPQADLIAQEVRRLELLLFREYIGRICWVFPVRTFGQYCPDCYDPVGKSKFRSNCPTCYDTKYVKGFLDPIAVPIQIDPSSTVTQQTPLLESQEVNATARLPFFPPLKSRDVIVEVENIRWQVVPVSTTQRLRAPLHQEVQLHRLPESDIEYTLPVNISNLQELQASPGRNFTCPHHLEAADDTEWWTSVLKGHGYDE